ncbi:MAG: hypothetical protein COB59_01200 [Rhodospirillaceae bacterium]|nr:MAG: hypothetical protein COB59_01200 [Rhodospirillaceae bacterium]
MVKKISIFVPQWVQSERKFRLLTTVKKVKINLRRLANGVLEAENLRPSPARDRKIINAEYGPT